MAELIVKFAIVVSAITVLIVIVTMTRTKKKKYDLFLLIIVAFLIAWYSRALGLAVFLAARIYEYIVTLFS
ncbi:hypothetical protein EBB07_08055 [Paenibacillaceae bacterium]|nr:hypothetical protein EBB07_08055 [Paenibacillaceae bacterium]